MANPPIATDNKITAEQFNELVTLYNVYWHDSANGGYSFDANHNTTNDNRRKGWGQPAVNISNKTVVTTSELITAEHTNYLISQINAGLWHISENSLDAHYKPLVIHRDPSTSISATVYTQLVDIYDSVFNKNVNTLDAYHLKCDPSAKSLTTNVASVTNPSSSTWTQDLSCENTFTFDNYNEARHFFNSGGELLVDMSASSGGTNDPSKVWDYFFNDMGVVRIGALSTTNDGDSQGDAAFTTITGGGFYSIDFTTGNYVPVYDVAADDRDNTIRGTNLALAGNTFSDYGQRRFRLHLKGEDGTSFKVHLKIELIEDTVGSVTDNTPYDVPIDTTIIAELGYAQPLDTPAPGDSSNNDRFSPKAGINFIFAEREVPGINNTVSWTESDITP